MCVAEYTGLCVNCTHRAGCALSSKSENVQMCEEFEVEKTDCIGKRCGSSKKSIYHTDAPPGLCRTCENYPACTFSKPESGKWYCEEFK